jgi:Uma2 family endonuclease
VSAASIPDLLTVAEFERIPDPPGGRYELHHGEVVLVTFPARPHKYLQRRLRKLLEPMAEPIGYVVDTEYPYRPLPEHEVWGADVACVQSERDQVQKWLEGSPELVIEVRSPSNTKDEIHDRAMTTLAGEGSLEFWLVDPKTRSVTVYTKTSGIHIYAAASAVPVQIFSAELSVDAIFEGLD